MIGGSRWNLQQESAKVIFLASGVLDWPAHPLTTKACQPPLRESATNPPDG